MKCTIEELNKLTGMFPDALLIDLLNYLKTLKKDVDKTK